MKIIWTDGATEDLEEIVLHIRKDSVDAAARLAAHIFARVMSLSSMSKRGRQRKSDGAWVIVVAPWPYVIVYEILEDAISIEGVRHASRDSRQ